MFDGLVHAAVTALLAAFGALARILSMSSRQAVKPLTMLSGCFVAMFMGVMAHFISVYFQLDPNLGYILAGVIGWAGPTAFEALIAYFQKRTGFDIVKKDGNDDGKN